MSPFACPPPHRQVLTGIAHRVEADTRDLVDAARRDRVFFGPGVAFYPNRPDTRTLRLSFVTLSPNLLKLELQEI